MKNDIKVLYIEDDAETRSLMSDIIGLRGYKFFEAERGITGINLAQKIIPDIIIIDLLLPDMDGYEVTTLLKSNQKLFNTPIIALTGETKTNVKELTLAAGCDGFISKPINVNNFLLQIDEFLEGRRDKLTDEDQKLYIDKYNRELVEKLSKKVIQLETANENLARLNKELLISKEELSGYNDRLFYLNKLANNLRRSIDPEDILKQLPEKTMEGFKVDRCIVFQVEPSTSTLVPVYSSTQNIKELQKRKYPFEIQHLKNLKDNQGLIWLRNQSEIIEAGLEKFSSTLKTTSFILSKLNDLGARSDSTEILKAVTDADQHQDLPDKFILFLDKSVSKGSIPTYEVRILKSFIQTVGTIYENMVLYHRLLETYKIREVQAVTDELTKLYNYRYLMRELQREINRTQRFGRPFSILMIDVDYFKNYNDLNGHLRGDVLLKKVAKILIHNTRKTDTVARYGGEEFLIILPGIPKAKAEIIAKKIQQLVEKEKFYNQQNQPGKNLTISIGVSTFPEDSKDLRTLIGKADISLYKAKKQGRNCVVVYSDSD
jgi:diguanylate cyclase (GGDEF)-like protein